MKSFIILDKDIWLVVAQFVAKDYDSACAFAESRGFTEERGYYVFSKEDFWG